MHDALFDLFTIHIHRQADIVANRSMSSSTSLRTLTNLSSSFLRSIYITVNDSDNKGSFAFAFDKKRRILFPMLIKKKNLIDLIFVRLK